MKRRTFLSATSTIGIVGVASSATLATSLYTNLSTSVLLEDFNETSKKVLDKFVSDISENAKVLGLDSDLAKRIAMPVHIFSNVSSKNSQSITYKNKNGQYILLTVENGSGHVKIVQEIY
jgi:D-arabinose 1-dehydrogenase-like Zn-dependent alcohol dehydrogenase